MNFEVVIFYFKLSLTFLDEIAAEVKGEIIFFFNPNSLYKRICKTQKQKKKESSLAKFCKEL